MIELPSDRSPSLGTNPFRRIPEPSLEYMLGGQLRRITGNQYECYDRIWSERTEDRNFIRGR
jgi:hypothetical protein